MNRLSCLLALLILTALAAPASAGSWPHERDGFMLGFNLGAGSATAKPDVGESDTGGGVSGSFRAAWAFSDKFLVGLESTAWTGITDLSTDITLSSYKLNFTWYPAAKGWFVRGGFGAGTATISSGLFGPTVSITDSGGSFGLGAGHEWRLTRTFALGLAVDYSTIEMEEGSAFSDFSFVNYTVQLNWYF